MKEIIERLKTKKQKIATMESCTGGELASSITNLPGSSEVFEFGAVTYSNKYKVKLGVDSNILEKQSVYSIETAKSMSKAITDYTNADYGVGITGQLMREDPNNVNQTTDIVYISIYIKETESYTTATIQVNKEKRIDNKKDVVTAVEKLLLTII